MWAAQVFRPNPSAEPYRWSGLWSKRRAGPTPTPMIPVGSPPIGLEYPTPTSSVSMIHELNYFGFDPSLQLPSGSVKHARTLPPSLLL